MRCVCVFSEFLHGLFIYVTLFVSNFRQSVQTVHRIVCHKHAPKIALHACVVRTRPVFTHALVCFLVTIICSY